MIATQTIHAHASGTSHPLGAEADRRANIERWRPLVNWALVVPHQIWLLVLCLGAAVVAFASWFSVLFTGRVPDTWTDYVVGVLRYEWRVTSFLYGWVSEYPSFSPAAGHIDPGDYPAFLYCARALERDRLTTFFRAVLALPHAVALGLLAVGVVPALVFAWFAVLLSGQWPEALHRFVTRYLRWQLRFSAYLLLVTDVYPPFGLQP